MDNVPQSYEMTLKQAEEKEKQYEWHSAAKYYQRALRVKSRIPAQPEIWERLGICYDRASRQAQDVESFKQIKKQSVDAFQKAASLYSEDSSTLAKRDSSLATAAYHYSRLASTPSEKKACYDECCTYSETALQAFEKAGDQLNYGKTCINLLICIYNSLYIALNLREKNVIAQKGIEWSQKAITSLTTIANKHDLLQAYSYAALITWYAANLSEREEWRTKLGNRSIVHSEKAIELSKEVTDPYLIAISRWAAALITLFFTKNIDSSLGLAKDMLQQASVINDNFLVGKAYYLLAFITNWMIPQEVDPEKQKEKHEEIIQYSEKGIAALQLVAQDLSITETYQYYIESHSYLANNFETTLVGKRAIAKKAVEGGQKGLDSALRSGSPDALNTIYHALSKMLYFLSNLEPSQDDQIKLLEEALDYRKKQIDTIEKAFPSHLWVVGVVKHYTALIQAKLSRSQTEESKKIAFLKDSISSLDDGLRACSKWIQSRNIPSLVAIVAGYEDDYGETLNELYSLTKEKDLLSQTIGIYEDAAEKYKQLEIPSRVAESYWKIAQNQAQLANHYHAASSFEQAAAGFKEAAEKIPHFAEFYNNYALYMKAWSAIELAKNAHQNEEYNQAALHYQTSAQYLDSSQQWRYLSQNFIAWALLEEAEYLSKLDKSLEAIDHFESASTRFIEAKQTLQEYINGIESAEEKQNAIMIINASNHRRDYCLARILLEEARIDDKEGKGILSANRYGLAAATFEKLVKGMDTDADRNEMYSITLLCQAWEKLKLGEANEAPDLCLEAAEMFHEAINYNKSGRSNLVLLGNHAFCRALENGTRFQATKDRAYYFKTKQYLESASNYYIKAGYETAALWVNATELKFDAFIYIDQAETEVHPQRLANRVKLYTLAEKCLEQAATLYEQAKYVGKQNEVMRSLEKVKEKRKFATSLGDVFQAPNVTLSTRNIPVPTPTHELPVGLESFEQINIQAHLDSWMKEINVGENLELEIDLINVGRHPAILLRLENVKPQGFNFVEKVGGYRLENERLNLRGRKLDPLSRDEIRYTLKANRGGTYALNPVIIFQDETGNQMSQELEPIAVTVKEFGILRWLRGPRE